jgi:flagella basal body P-ring formation protein FlgA
VLATELSPREISLRTSIIVESEYLTLEDFFGISDERASTRIARSPKPGRTATFEAKWLYRVARAYKIDWRPMSLATRVIVERASQEIYRDQIEDALTASLREKGIDGKIEITMRRLIKIHVATNQLASVGIERLAFEPGSGRFIANLTAPANDPSGQRYRVGGRVHRLKTIPVVNKRMRRGREIRQNNIEWINVRVSKIPQDIVMDEEDLIGMAAKRTITKNTPIRYSYIRKPILIKRGSLVTINLTTPAMRLTAQGKALQEGSIGDTVQVKNIQSKQKIEARVTGVNKVAVVLLGRNALN